MSALFKAYPELAKKIPRISLGTFPTPIQPLVNLGYDNLWIKRDDLSSTVYGGNKIRKLEYILAAVKQSKARQVITFGGIGTNHGLATAIFCNQLGISCKLLLFWQPVTANVQQNLRLFKVYEARLNYRKSLWNTVLSYYLLERIKHPRAYFLFAGGSNVVGTIGYVNAVFELKEQIGRTQAPEPAVILCPVGSGGTLSGLTLGVQLAGLRAEVIGVRVSASHLGPFAACTPAKVEKLMRKTYRHLKQRCPRLPDAPLGAPQILHDFFGRGYGFPTREGEAACRAAKEAEGLILDPTYTAKAFAAVLDYCRKAAKNSEPVLYWHTYNSVDLPQHSASLDWRQLPKSLQVFMTQEALEF
jgi:D-cysteine desulfhydrase